MKIDTVQRPLVWIGALLALGCSAAIETGEIDEQSAEPLLAKPVTPFWNTTIPVCWCDHEDCDDENGAPKNMTQLAPYLASAEAAVDMLWGSASADFTWQTGCPHTGEYVRVEPIWSDSTASWMSAGQGALIPYAPDTRSGLIRFGDNRSVRANANHSLHEFGHLVGFEHENGRPDGPPDCDGTEEDARFTFFDGYSKMATTGACRGHQPSGSSHSPLLQNTGLDFAGFQMWYGPKDQWQQTARNFCMSSGDRLHFGKFDNDGQTDLLCNRRSTGVLYVERANNGFGGPSDWSMTRNFCTGSSDKLLVADFNGDGRDDVLCNYSSGLMEIDLANSSGQFLGTDWSSDIDYCTSSTQRLIAGRFNSDVKADLLCNDLNSGDMTIDWSSSSYFGSVNWSFTDRNFCLNDSCERMESGDFDGDARTDILCNNICNGALHIDLNTSGVFSGSEFVQGSRAFCASGETFLVADMSGDGRDDIVCWNQSTGDVTIDVGDQAGFFDDAPPTGPTSYKVKGPMGNFCKGSGKSLHLGHFDTNGKADFLCHQSDLAVAYSELPLALLHYSTTINGTAATPNFGISATQPFALTDGANYSLVAAMTDPGGADTGRDVDLEVYAVGTQQPVCAPTRQGTSFEWCALTTSGNYTVRAVGVSTGAKPISLQVYIVPRVY